MTILELLNAANEAYPDKYLAEYYTETGERNPHGSGDTLAEFIVNELIETFENATNEEDQLNEAIRVMERAQNELEAVINAIKRKRK